MNKKKAVKSVAAAAALGAGAFAAADIIKALSVKAIPDLPPFDEGAGLVSELLLYLENPRLLEEDGAELTDEYIINALTPAKKYIDGRYDCQDFRMHSLLRLQYSHIETIKAVSPKGAQMIEDIFLNAKFWMTEPGEDSMCYWSENHQILYAVAEYLAGQMWAGRTFSNDGATGLEHMARGRARIGHWLEQRFRFGYSEFNSSNYYLYNVGPAANFIQFAAGEDRILVERMKICLDLLLFDVASGMQKYTFTAPTGRAYVDNMVGVTGDRVRKLTDFAWGLNDNYLRETHQMLVNFYAMLNASGADSEQLNLYEIPPVILEIGKDENTQIIKSSHGMNTSELAKKGFVGLSDAQIMRQLSMEAFTNPEVIENTIAYIEKNNMFSNKFVNYFKMTNLRLVRRPGFLSKISRRFNPMPNGIAIQRANLYTFRTKSFLLSNVQRYHPGQFGAQQMLNVANFGEKAVAFTCHPAREESEKTVRGYPGYWAGYGRAPHAVQHENVLILLYQIPSGPGFLELYGVPQFTHTYLPEAFFDETVVSGRHAFARSGEAFLAITAASGLKYKPFSRDSALAFKNGLEEFPNKCFDLIQNGSNQFWVYELSDSSKESFEEFTRRIKENPVSFDGQGRICYHSNGREYKTTFGANFFVDNEAQELEHKRFESAYCTAERESGEYFFSLNGHSLRLNFEQALRELN